MFLRLDIADGWRKDVRKRHLKTGRSTAVTAGLYKQWAAVDLISQSSTTFQAKRPLQLLLEIPSSRQCLDSVSKELIEKSENELDKKISSPRGGSFLLCSIYKTGICSSAG